MASVETKRWTITMIDNSLMKLGQRRKWDGLKLSILEKLKELQPGKSLKITLSSEKEVGSCVNSLRVTPDSAFGQKIVVGASMKEKVVYVGIKNGNN